MANTMQVMININTVRYVIIPLAGFFLGSLVFLLVYKKYSNSFFARLETYTKIHSNKLFSSFVIIYSLFFLITVSLRYSSNHLGIFDFGVYDWRVWLIHGIQWTEWLEKFRSAVMGHFQPIKVAYSILYDLGIEPVALNILQAVAVISGIIPLYLIARIKLKNHLLILSVSFLYLLYPATQFNISIDFHPDHLIIPILFWCYYFIEKEKYHWTIPLVLIGYTLKEPLILAIAFMGLYIAWGKKRLLFGLMLFLISLVVFYIATFEILPAVANFQPHETVIGSSAFGYLFESKGIMPIAEEVLRFEKWRFPFFLLFPLLFLPLLKFKEFLPAIPLLVIPILSTISHHQNVASHYTAGIIPPVFVSLISAVAYLHDRFGDKIALGILSWVCAMMLAFNIVHSPSPVAVAFWNKEWSHGKWHYTNYIENNHDAILRDAITLVSADPSIKVVTHSEIYNKTLAHRNFYKPFPEKWKEADYILLDNRRGGYVGDTLNEDIYRMELEKLRGDTGFEVIYNKDGVLLFKRLK